MHSEWCKWLAHYMQLFKFTLKLNDGQNAKKNSTESISVDPAENSPRNIAL